MQSSILLPVYIKQCIKQTNRTRWAQSASEIQWRYVNNNIIIIIIITTTTTTTTSIPTVYLITKARVSLRQHVLAIRCMRCTD